MEKYRVSGIKTEKLTVIKETEKQIVYIALSGTEYREAKNSQYAQWFETFYLSKNYLIEKWESEIKRIQQSLDFAKNSLEKILNLSEL